MKKKARPQSANQNALIIGVGNYRDPVTKLPAVANDVRVMGELLASRKGAFTKSTTRVLVNSQAKRGTVLRSLQVLLEKASAESTVFAYLAGHGMILGNEYFYLPYDFNDDHPKESSVPLSELKRLFDASPAKRAFLWLDCCHAGGVLRRRNVFNETTVIRRTLQAVHGSGKVIVAACKPEQSAYEDDRIGHGLFTDALVRGLKGEAKTTSGEVTAGSLYDFIDRDIANASQQPVFFGEQTGRIVLMNHGTRNTSAKSPAKRKKNRPTKASAPRSGTWVMLGDGFHIANKIRSHSDGSVELSILPHSPESEAQLVALKPRGFSHRGNVRYAADREACDVEVLEVINEVQRGKAQYMVRLKSVERISNPMMDMSINGVGPDEIAKRRIGRLLFGEHPASPQPGFGEDRPLADAISGSCSGSEINGSVIQNAYAERDGSADWKSIARLKAISLMKSSGAIEHVLELRIGAVRAGRVKVSFRGIRPKRYANAEPVLINLDGYCRLDV